MNALNVTHRASKVSGMPLQAMPVERHITGAAMANAAGVEASAWYDTLLNMAKGALPIVRQIAGAL